MLRNPNFAQVIFLGTSKISKFTTLGTFWYQSRRALGGCSEPGNSFRAIIDYWEFSMINYQLLKCVSLILILYFPESIIVSHHDT